MRYCLAVGLFFLLQGVVTPGGGISTGDIKEDFSHQMPTQSPHTLERACTTQLGICRMPNLIPPGQPCHCLTANGARVDGYVIAWRWTGVPTDLK
jgi:hypothetical protein